MNTGQDLGGGTRPMWHVAMMYLHLPSILQCTQWRNIQLAGMAADMYTQHKSVL